MTNSSDFVLETVAVIGLGLIGGSFALDLQRLGLAKRLIGYDNNPKHCEEAQRLGIVSYASSDLDDVLSEAEFVLLAIPVGSVSKTAAELRKWLKRDAILTDVGSVKESIVKLMHQEEYQHLRFVGGHPIAGSEQFGPSSARTHLFDGKALILTPDEDTDSEALALVRQIWERLGGKVLEINPSEHDYIFAWVSHLPHLLAYASIKAISEAKHPEILSHSGAGLKDFSRIASSSPEMWADIFLENKTCLLSCLQGFRNTVEQVQDAIVEGDRSRLVSLLRESKDSRDRWVH